MEEGGGHAITAAVQYYNGTIIIRDRTTQEIRNCETLIPFSFANSTFRLLRSHQRRVAYVDVYNLPTSLGK